MAKLVQFFLGLINYKAKDKTYKRIKLKYKLNKSNILVMMKNDTFPYITKVLFSSGPFKISLTFPDFP